MKRRSFLKSFFAVPFVPAFLKDWVPEDIREEVEEERTIKSVLSDPTLAMATGEPLAISVIVPPGRRIKVTGIAHVVSPHSFGRPAMVMLQEGDTKLSAVQDVRDGPMDLWTEVVLEPTPGTHTYKLTLAEGVVHAPFLSMIKAEVWP